MPEDTNSSGMSLNAGMATFSGYMAFSGKVLGSGVPAIGVVFSVTDGVITGAFDKHGNPDKSFDRVIGTAAMAWASAELGAMSGSKIGAIIGTAIPGVGTAAGAFVGGVIGAVSGAVVGGLYGSEAYDFYVDKYHEFGNFLADGIMEAGNMTIEGFGKLLDMADSLSDFVGNEIDNAIDFWGGLFDGLADDLGDWLDDFGDWIDSFINPLLYDPIALDLDGDGAISLIADKTGSVYFDHDCDGVAFRSSWVSPNDGILVYDRNANGKIDNGSELFGNFTPKFDGNLATDGFNALSDFDTNNDGIISNLDENFDKLQIWQDLNSNGVSETNELKSLSKLGIESLNLNKFTNLNLLVA